MADNWLTNMGNAMKNTRGSDYYNGLFDQGDYEGIIGDVIKKSGGYGTMSPYYYQYLMKNAKRYMLQEGLKQLAAGVPPDQALNGDSLAASLGGAISGNPEGYIFQKGQDSQSTFRQALSNLSTWLDPKYKGTAAYNMAAAMFEDPELLQAMMMQSMGEGYGGIFRKGLMNQMSDQFDELKRFPNRGNDWWNTMFGLYGGFAGDKGAPAGITTGDIMKMPSKPYASAYNPSQTTGSGGQAGTASASGTGMGDVQRQGQPAAGAQGAGAQQGDLSADQIAANANKPENIGTNFEAVSVYINGREYKYAKGRDGLWHVMPAEDYASYRSPGGGGAGDAGAAAKAMAAGPQAATAASPAAAAASVPDQAAPAADTSKIANRNTPITEQSATAQASAVGHTLSQYEAQLATQYQDQFRAWIAAGTSLGFAAWLTQNTGQASGGAVADTVPEPDAWSAYLQRRNYDHGTPPTQRNRRG